MNGPSVVASQAVEESRKPEPAPAPRTGSGSVAVVLARIPLAVRMLVYGTTFLSFVLILLPWLAHRAGLALLPWRMEIGAARAVGWVLFAACLAAYAWCSVVLTRRGRGAYVEFDPPREFVAVGPYGWCRNPLAASLLGGLLGLAMAFSSLGILLLFLVAIPLAHAQVVLLEEPLLKQRFGQPYLDYLARVPRWIPRPPRRTP